MCEAAKGYRFSQIVGYAIGPGIPCETLAPLCSEVVSMETIDNNFFRDFRQRLALAFSSLTRCVDPKPGGLPIPERKTAP
jgi:hypothetical protein